MATTTTRLDRTAWQPYFDNMSRLLEGKQAEVEVASLEIGDQIEARWLPLTGILYDPKNDLLSVAFEGLDHTIRHPQEIYIEQDAMQLKSMEVRGEDDTQQIIRLRDPLMLRAP